MSSKNGFSVLGALALLVGSQQGFASPRGPSLLFQVLKTQAALDAEFCGQDYFLVSEKLPCEEHEQDQYLKIYFPVETAKVIAGHVARMESDRNFRRLDLQDFFHGHLILYGRSQDYPSLGAMLSDITDFLYHTEEFTGRWGDEQDRLPLDKRIPRSLLGKPDGSLIPAVQAVDPAKLPGHFYEKAGTIYIKDVVDANPQLTRLAYPPYDGDPRPAVTLTFTAPGSGAKWHCALDTEFYIRPKTDGRFRLASGEAYDTYLLCKTELPATVTD